MHTNGMAPLKSPGQHWVCAPSFQTSFCIIFTAMLNFGENISLITSTFVCFIGENWLKCFLMSQYNGSYILQGGSQKKVHNKLKISDIKNHLRNLASSTHLSSTVYCKDGSLLLFSITKMHHMGLHSLEKSTDFTIEATV